ncbi:hypothetical protein LTR10_016303 [Elasticomyces elasticus]|uniref:Uncharacterized protein n=1 Tax=Exophiala sideris TaxID=1016849 RepID=A0ABR0J5J4_9EURO|nr:hypothetical protein LTR10_016303 [Elasticomyces elasticus]KAK5028312.1 hypothetical protein LTS07_006403 [Exophiala sideris]KAK5036043.1 hypothetical protein LTR13_005613 [Exophiala sideris]KAK5057080.1 hypothetical protein LTR69_007718 [Exophiala sideris]KAK5181487.1 hypothetical protein LTR44_006282 [Eurotiomycetes sp. CCFEE 6388]
MTTSRYEPLGFGVSGMRETPGTGERLQSSTSIDDNIPITQDFEDGSNGPAEKPNVRFFGRSVSKNPKEEIAYTGFEGDVPARTTRRRGTGNSLYKVASSVWSTTSATVSRVKVDAPWKHEFLEKHGSPPSDTVRYFDHRRQRRRLFANSSLQWMFTALVCASLAILLYTVSRSASGVTTSRKHTFNAIITGLSLILGLNLASSMKTYANMLRWRLLASGYRTLDEFESILECESQRKTLTMLWSCRTRGRWLPNKLQTAAAVSLLVNLALQVFTALLGLTYSIDVSEKFVILRSGLVSIADVSYIGTTKTLAEYQNNQNSSESLLAQVGVANQLGVEGQDYTVLTTDYRNDDGTSASNQIYTDSAASLYWYRFIDQNPLSANGLEAASVRKVNATATCKSYKVVYGGEAGFQTSNEKLMYDVTYVDNEGNNITLAIPEQATGATTWMSDITSDCGDRCSQVFALQTADNITSSVSVPRFWSCYSYVSNVSNVDEYPTPSDYRIPNTQAQILAGAIGWSGILTEYTNDTADTDLQRVLYQADSQWSAPGNISDADMARLLMKFTTGAIAALDADGPRLNVTGYTPVSLQLLNVHWNYAGAILAGIPVAQALILALVIALGDRAIIKDGSPLSTARLLRPIVDKLGDTGCLLTGEEIAAKLGNYRVIYGVTEPDGTLPARGAGDDGQVRHLDLLEETEGLGYTRGRMPIGKYDGKVKHPSAAIE